MGRRPLCWRSNTKVTMATSGKLQSGTPTSDRRAAFWARPESFQATVVVVFSSGDASHQEGHFTSTSLQPAPVTMEIFLSSDSLLPPQRAPECDSVFCSTPRLPRPSHHISIFSIHSTSPPTAPPPHPSILYSLFSLQSALLIFQRFSEPHADVPVRTKMELFFDFSSPSPWLL